MTSMNTAPSGTPLLTVSNVRSVYGETVALQNVSMEIRENEFFALLGPSGCGKTTLLRSIAGFETPASGSILLDGEDLLRMPANKRPVNMMFQSYALFPHLSVEKNIAYGLEAERLPRAEVQRRVGEIIEVIGLERMAKRRPGQLSGGQRQRVALARAIVKRPRLLLLDEPLSALDRKVRAEMQSELKRLQHEVGMTFVMVTHDQDEAMTLADRVAVLNGGVVEQLDAPIDLYARPHTKFVAEFIGTANLLAGVTTPEGVRMANGREVRAEHRLGEGLDAYAVVRPEDVTLVASGTPGAFEGTLADAYFLGGSWVVTIDSPLFDTPIRATTSHRPKADIGDALAVTFSLDHPVAVPAR